MDGDVGEFVCNSDRPTALTGSEVDDVLSVWGEPTPEIWIVLLRLDHCIGQVARLGILLAS